MVDAEVLVVIDPTILLDTLTVLLPDTNIPLNDALVAPAVNVMEPVPVEAPMVLPLTVPMFTFPACTLIPNQFAAPELA